MVTVNQKSTTGMHIKKEKESKHNTQVSYQITGEQNKRGREEKRPIKTNPKQLAKWHYTERTNISIIT